MHQVRTNAITRIYQHILRWQQHLLQTVQLTTSPFANILARLWRFMADLTLGIYPAQETASIAFVAILPLDEVVFETVAEARTHGMTITRDLVATFTQLYMDASLLNYTTVRGATLFPAAVEAK